MYKEYLQSLDQFSPLSEASRELLRGQLSVKSVSKGGMILAYGEVCRHMYYVHRGLIRIFYYKDKKEITEWIADEKQFFFSIISFFEDTPSTLIIEAIDDCEIIQLSKKGLDELGRSNLEIANLIIGFYSRSLILSQKRMESLQFETAKSRYQNLLEQQPNILKKVPLQHVASFLGITQETLSRIRASF